MYTLDLRASGHGYEFQATMSGFEKEPSAVVQNNAKASLEQLFNDVTGRPVVTSAALVVAPPGHWYRERTGG